MNASLSFIRRFRLGVYFLLTFGCFWLATPPASISPLLPGLVAAFAPALVALALAALLEGRAGVGALAGALAVWRVGFRWHAAALGIPLVVSPIILAVSRVTGESPAPLVGPILPLAPIIFVLAAGEELGWRGFALPRMLERLAALPVALGLGVIHALYHLPLWAAPGFPESAYSWAALLVTSLALGVIWTWLYLNTRGSVLLTTLFHGAFNTAGNVFFAEIPPGQLNWLMPLGFGVVALVIIVFNGPSLNRISQP